MIDQTSYNDLVHMSQMNLDKLSLGIEDTNTSNQLNMNYFIKYITNLVNSIVNYISIVI